MDSDIFRFGEEQQKLKSKLLILSSISLFIGISKSLPEKVAILGLDLSQNKALLGWFILVVTIYFFIKFSVVSILEIAQYLLPVMIRIKTQKTTGNTLGLSADDCYQIDQYPDDDDIGTTSGELKDIQKRNDTIQIYYKQWFIKLNNFTIYLIDFLFPVLLFAVGVYKLYSTLRVT